MPIRYKLTALKHTVNEFAIYLKNIAYLPGQVLDFFHSTSLKVSFLPIGEYLRAKSVVVIQIVIHLT